MVKWWRNHGREMPCSVVEHRKICNPGGGVSMVSHPQGRDLQSRLRHRHRRNLTGKMGNKLTGGGSEGRISPPGRRIMQKEIILPVEKLEPKKALVSPD